MGVLDLRLPERGIRYLLANPIANQVNGQRQDRYGQRTCRSRSYYMVTVTLLDTPPKGDGVAGNSSCVELRPGGRMRAITGCSGAVDPSSPQRETL
jgi:hypothetical protein